MEVIQPVCNHSSHNHSNDLADLTFCVSNLAQRQGCGVSLVKPSTVFKPLHQCHLLQGASLDYSLKSDAKCVAAAPCTNRPVKCPHCPGVFWSYSMMHHLELKHPNETVDPTFAKSVAWRYHEKATTLQLLTTPLKKVKINNCMGAQCMCKSDWQP